MSSNKAGAVGGSLLPVVYHRTEAQCRPHETFKTGVVHSRESRLHEPDGGRTLILARPPAWTEQELNCHGRMLTFDWSGGATQSHHGGRAKPSDADKARARELCSGCPAAPAQLGGTGSPLGDCLEAAMREEGDVSGQYRHGIRGGVLPTDRGHLARQIKEAS